MERLERESYCWLTIVTQLELLSSSRLSLVDTWSAASLMTDVNSAEEEGEPWMSDDQRHLFFRRTQGGLMDLYMSSRAEPSTRV